nr:hypothetical protein [Tanacetum cinerariifolium]GFB18477.1 hypothetical protein [Tanacetum cinerariifolium]
CLFIVGLSGGGSGVGVRVGEWQENGESGVVESWREKLVGMNSGPFKTGGRSIFDSNVWSPEFVPFMGPKDGSGTVGSSKKLECSDKL